MVAVDHLVERWRERLGGARRDSAFDRLLRVLPGAPVVTVASAVAPIDRSVQATNAAVARLPDANVLRQISIGRRNRAFEVVGVLDALTALEGGLASPTGDTREDPPVRPVPYRPGRRGGPSAAR